MQHDASGHSIAGVVCVLEVECRSGATFASNQSEGHPVLLPGAFDCACVPASLLVFCNGSASPFGIGVWV